MRRAGLAALVLGFVAAAPAGGEERPGAPVCGENVRHALLAPAAADEPPFKLACSLALSPGDVVRRPIVIAGRASSGLVLDCRGAQIAPEAVGAGRDTVLVRSGGRTVDAAIADRLEDVEIRGCRIEGTIRIAGSGRRTADPESFRPDYTARAQAAAPTRVRLVDLDISGSGGVAVYLGRGVTEAALLRSRITGRMNGPAIYLDAESARNRIEDTVFAADLLRREVIAVDGSAANVIRGNRFERFDLGGVFLYRNCGEDGTVRQQAPTGNLIAGNVFDTRRFRPSRPAVWVGSREGNRGYCSADAGHGIGSSIDDGDHAENNRVVDNVFLGADPAVMIEPGRGANEIAGNRSAE